jgi:hypothetical protein
MSSQPMTEDDLADLSDEELMGMASPPAMTGEISQSTEEGEDIDGENAETAAVKIAPEAEVEAEAAGDAEEHGASGSNALSAADEDLKKPVQQVDPQKKDPATAKEDLTQTSAEPGPKPVDYEAAYKQIMAPFKANGKEVRLESPEEVIRLMQMGANYTKKMQALQPNLRLLRMLENNGLLDENKLSLLIDAEKKNPAAIKKLVKDSGIDPMDIDVAADPGYAPGNHKVSDEELRFISTIEDVALEPGGKEAISHIHKTWDKKSKDALFSDPDILRVIHTQRQNGIYGQISDEIERRKMLGNIPENVPFLEVYHKIGRELDAAGRLTPTTIQSQPAAENAGKGAAPAPAQSAPAAQQPGSERKVLDQRTGVKPKPSPVANGDKARAASPTRAAASKPSSQDFNPLALSDEEFEKNTALMRRI